MNKPSKIRLLLLYVLAALLAYLLACIFSSQSVISHLEDMDVAIGFTERLRISVHDVLGMTEIFLPVIAIGFALALPVAGFLSRRLPAWRTELFVLAGALTLIAIHFAMEMSFDIVLIAGARSIPGLASQALAGAIGAWVFARGSHTRV